MLYQYRIPPLLLVGILAFLMYLLRDFPPSFEWPRSLVLPLSLLLSASGFLLILAGAITFRRYKTTVNPVNPEASTALVTSGVFSFTRNPMYLGFLAILIAWGIYLQNGLSLLLPLLFFFYIGKIQISVEEKALSARFGESFQCYTQKVRRWL